MVDRPEFLFRFGIAVETAGDLESACEDAVRRGFPHGVSAVSENYREDASVASVADLELYFTIEKTGRRRIHYTIVLPHPVTDENAQRFNAALGRSEG
jgi:hypothetical protein